ncbi:rhodanese-like domain-containing protein [Salirhabdus sp. Marseille-P4669]|uniref:rhodanese-like domain-containing protein n=1 Tax=Salirhabdus sp. Marseille-P4669 TaxID=2042310 RepID=UPI000C7CCC14|nr:rhodanese-like domain-containing protein [Salirhabdus sp. Marseille-P4669]
MNIKEIEPEQLDQLIETDKNEYVIIDVREDEEVANGMIKGAKHIPLQNIPEAIANLDTEKEYVLVCRSGRRSLNACLYMEKEGFNVRNMVGGMLEWKGEVVF